MTRANFRTFCKKYIEFDAQPYITADADWNTLINERLELFSALTCCLFHDRITLGQTAVPAGWCYGGQYPRYNLLDGGFYALDTVGYTRRVFWPKQVRIAGRLLRDLGGKPGPISNEDMDALFSQTTAGSDLAADMLYWSWDASFTMRLFPGPDNDAFNVPSVSGDISGYYLHPALTNDAHEIYVPDHMERAAACFVAVGALDPRAAGSSLEKMQRLDAQAADMMTQLMAQANLLMDKELGSRLAVPVARGEDGDNS